MMNNFEIKVFSSLDDISLDSVPQKEYKSGSMLLNERFNFCIAVYNHNSDLHCAKLVLSGIDEGCVILRRVGFVPVIKTNQVETDDYVISTNSGVYPDVLFPIEDIGLELIPKKWTAVWVTVDGTNKTLRKGEKRIDFKLTENNQTLGRAEFNLSIINNNLPKHNLLLTNWIHFDCIAEVHNLEVFSEEYYSVAEKYVRSAVLHGQNMLLTPLFTFPLDTEIGGERDTFQLVDIKVKNQKYSFDFSRLKYFIEFVFKCGIEYIEFSHLFTQWGADACPKIMAEADGKYQKIFGWDDDSASQKYRDFLSALLPELVAFIASEKIGNKCFFHISDEPHLNHKERYTEHRALLKKYIGDIPIMDAIGECEFVDFIDMPVVATSAAEEFAKLNKPHMVYYCCGQSCNYLSNRFMAMPNQRNRILGIQLYKNKVKGFLHWGFNFYHTVKSRKKINPYSVTDAGGYFAAGDCFVVYPHGETEINESLRLEVFYEGLQDYSALMLLESLYGADFTNKLLEREEVFGFTKYKRDSQWHLSFRKEINDLISKKS